MCIIVYDLCLGWICHYVLTAYGAESCFHNVFVAESVMKKVHCCFTYDLSYFRITSFCTDFISHCRHCGECVWICVGRADDTRKQCEALTWCFLSNSDICFQPGYDEVNTALAENPIKRKKMKGEWSFFFMSFVHACGVHVWSHHVILSFLKLLKTANDFFFKVT